MKGFIIATIIMATVVVCAAANAAITKSMTTELTQAAHKLNFENGSADLEAFLTLWEKKRRYFEATVTGAKLEYVSEGIDMMQAAITANDKGMFEYGLVKTCVGLKRIADFSSPKLEIIF